MSEAGVEIENPSDAELIEIAKSLKASGLAVPATFFLELHKPLLGLAENGVIAFKPLLNMVVGSKWAGRLSALCASADNVDRLISKLEQV